jgi:hypothetical protein
MPRLSQRLGSLPTLILLLCLLLVSTAAADDFICGDADANTLVEMADAEYLMAYIFGGGPAPVPEGAGDVNNTRSVNVSDAVSLIGFDLSGAPVPCESESGYLGPLAGNEIILDCPVEVDVPTDTDTILVDVYWSNDIPIGGFSLGFHYDSDLIEAIGRDASASEVPNPAFFTPPLIDPTNNLILVGWADFTGAMPIPPTTNGFMFTLQFEMAAGVEPHCVDIDSSFVPPAGDWIFSTTDGGSIVPGFVDCDWEIIIGGAECEPTNEPPTAVCQNVTVGADGNCQADASVDGGSFDTDGTIVDITQNPPGPYPLGETSVWLVVTDDIGDVDSCEALVTVVDVTPPTAQCPTDITVSTDPGVCEAVVDFSIDATDNCGVGGVTADPVSGSVFPVGITAVEVVAVDLAGNADTCYFDVTVNDTEDPTVTCPGDMTAENDPGQCGAVVTYTAIVDDNCPGATVALDPPSGSFLEVGDNTITATGTDAAGNQASCQFTMTVFDIEPPVLTCPDDIEVDNDPGEDGAIVEFTIVATDNCPGVQIDAVPPSGSFFPLGTTTVLVGAQDVWGHLVNCQFDVTVNQVNNPPVANDTTVHTTMDTPVGAQMQAYDPDGDPLTYSLDDGPFNGMTSGFDANTGAFTYEPNPGYVGPDSVEFHAEDAALSSNQAFVYFVIGGAGAVVIIPPEQYVYYMFRLETYFDTVYFGNFPPPYMAADVNLGSVTINGMVPTSIQVIPNYPDFTGEVVCATFPLGDLVGPWLPLYDTTQQQFTVDGEYNDAAVFSLLGEVTVYGKRSTNPAQYIVPPDEIVFRGDVDKSGIFNIGDVTALIWFIFGDGEPPLPRMVADVDCSYSVNVSDAVYMIQYIFDGGPAPCPPPSN